METTDAGLEEPSLVSAPTEASSRIARGGVRGGEAAVVVRGAEIAAAPIVLVTYAPSKQVDQPDGKVGVRRVTVQAR